MTKIKKITIIAAGNGGITAAADLRQKGFEIVLYDFPEKIHKMQAIIDNGGIKMKFNGEESFVDGIICSTNIKEAIKDSDIIMPIIPGLLVEKYAELLAPSVDENQLIFFNAAAAMSGIRFINKAKQMDINKNFFIAESNSLTYATRANIEDGSVDISLKVKETLLAALPKEKTTLAAEMISQIYDGIKPVEDILRIALENANPEVHPGVCLLNSGRIDKYGHSFSLYRDGYTEHTANLLKGIAVERRNIANAFGYELEDIIESRVNRGYFSEDIKDIHLMFNESPVFSLINGPHSVKSRYFIEDIEDGLVLWSDLGKLAKVSTPLIDSVITLASCVIGIDFYKKGLTLEKLQLNDFTLQQLKNHI